MDIQSGFAKILPYLPAALQMPVSRIAERERQRVQELRLRIGRNLHAVIGGDEYAVLPDGQLAPETAEGIAVTRQMLDTLFQNACMHSVHSVQTAIRNGFLTAAGGNRIGLCGTAVLSENRLETVRTVSSMNIRIASARIGCAETIAAGILQRGGRDGLLIAGAPASGKTTVLRDLARILGKTKRIALMDERGEIAAVQNGVPQFDVGTQTDIFDSYPKAEGIETAVRVMSPEWIVCDELGGAAECEAILHTAQTGVGMIASVHAGSIAELYAKPQLSGLIATGIFRRAVLLGTGASCGQVLQSEMLRRTGI